MSGTSDSQELQKFISLEDEWKTLYTAYSSPEAEDIPTQFKLVLQNAEDANEVLNGNQFGVGLVDITITSAEIQEFADKNTVLKEFTNEVHQDVVALIDDPFATAISTAISNTESINTAGYSQDEGGLSAEVASIMSTINGSENTEDLSVALENALYNIASSPEFNTIYKGIQEAITNHGSYQFIKNGYRYIVEHGKFKLIDARGITHTREQAADFISSVFDIAEGKGRWGEYGSLIKRSGIKLNKLDSKDVNVALETLAADVKKAGGVYEKYKKGLVLNSALGSLPFADAVDLAKAAKTGEKISSKAKFVKNLGIVGDIISLGTNISDNYHVGADGKVDEKTLIVGTAVDFAVDAGTGAASSAIGAAVGSFFLPPLGTIVGAAVGMGIDYAINKDWDGDGDGASLVDAGKNWLHDKLGIG